MVTQVGFLVYMTKAMWTSLDKTPCGTPMLLQLIGLLTFLTACVSELKSFGLTQIALYTTRLRTAGAGVDTYTSVRPTSTRGRWILALAPLSELAVELATAVIGTLYLILSENLEELVLNAVAVNFVTQIDDMMLAAFVHKASIERLNKYEYEVLWGIEAGDTQLKGASTRSKKLLAAQEFLPVGVLVVAMIAVVSGQLYGMRTDAAEYCRWV